MYPALLVLLLRLLWVIYWTFLGCRVDSLLLGVATKALFTYSVVHFELRLFGCVWRNCALFRLF